MRRSSSDRRRAGAGALVLLLLVLAPAGCFSYRPIETGALRPQTDVRVHLVRNDDNDDVGFLRAGPLMRLTGETVGWDDTDLRLAVWRGDLRAERNFQVGRQTITVPWSSVRLVEERRISWWKTGALAGAAGAGIGVVVYLITSTVGGGTSNGNGGGDPS